MLASTAAARRRKLDVLAWVVGVATAIEENRIKTESICVGKGLTAAIHRAGRGPAPARGEDRLHLLRPQRRAYRSEEYAFALLRTQAAFVDAIDRLTPASCWGDVGRRLRSPLRRLAIASGLRGYAKGPRAMLWTSSEGGRAAQAILHLATRSA